MKNKVLLTIIALVAVLFIYNYYSANEQIILNNCATGETICVSPNEFQVCSANSWGPSYDCRNLIDNTGRCYDDLCFLEVTCGDSQCNGPETRRNCPEDCGLFECNHQEARCIDDTHLQFCHQNQWDPVIDCTHSTTANFINAQCANQVCESTSLRVCNTGADVNCDNMVTGQELSSYVNLWSVNLASGQELSKAVTVWARG